MIPAAHWRLQVYDYTGRLMRAIGMPETVIATHWDMQSAPYGASQDAQLDQAETFVREVKEASAETRVIVPRHFETVTV